MLLIGWSVCLSIISTWIARMWTTPRLPQKIVDLQRIIGMAVVVEAGALAHDLSLEVKKACLDGNGPAQAPEQRRNADD